ncbi:MAG: hypothetical protein JWL97_3572 [Gemmatimonadales bacterium]|nr:hypothetical protein [Gemmatimonadales bacterium]
MVSVILIDSHLATLPCALDVPERHPEHLPRAPSHLLSCHLEVTNRNKPLHDQAHRCILLGRQQDVLAKEMTYGKIFHGQVN